MVYNKLVRDKIPEIIKKNGSESTFRVLDNNEYLTMLEKKLYEELSEYSSDKSIYELADMLEVIYAVCRAQGYSTDELESIRIKKAEERGGFEDKIFLMETFDGKGDNR